MAGLGAPELLIVLVVILVLFGGAKLPKLARSLGQAQKEFKQGMDDPETPEITKGTKPAGETVTMSKADLDALLAEREARARQEGSSSD